jgi:hypothetical protein
MVAGSIPPDQIEYARPFLAMESADEFNAIVPVIFSITELDLNGNLDSSVWRNVKVSITGRC